ncbi:MAG: Gfo/Idh/MocA family oxidoreductase [Prolixibacteraceae bacterium]|nr:Gfo/Idh/MocA family oxidoreductase [Prolixibacteraceae bacterium]
MSKLRIGMVGMGFIADWHYQGFQANPDADMTGMCHNFHGDEKQQAAEKAQLEAKCKKWGIKAYESFDEMVTSPDIDAMIIGSINPYHFDQIKKAFDNGKHIMVEKPVVTEVDQLDEIEKLSKEKGVKILPAHNFVYRGAVKKAKEIIDSGKLGQIIHASFVVTHTIGEGHRTGWRAIKKLAKGGALIDSGHHLVYQTLYLLGKPEKLHGFTSKMVLKNMECEDTAQVSLYYPDGSIGLVMQSWTSDHADGINGVRIFGTKGGLVISDALYFEGEKLDTDVDYPESFQNQAKAFSDYILKDVAPLSGLEDVRNTLKITYGCYDSAELGKVINL